MKLPEMIAARVLATIAELKTRSAAEPTDAWAQVACRFDALPLYRDLGGTGCLLPAGQIIQTGWDDEGPPSLVDPALEVAMLVAGVQRYPWLKPLLPTRGVDARRCAVCKGSGVIRIGRGAPMFCGECSGLGWRSRC